jgi:1-acyl-sn-glycerol-3-phosphate acyltransferase
MTPWFRRRLHDAVFWTAGPALTFTHSLRISGRANVPRSGPFLMVSNHVSMMDPVLVGLASRRYMSYVARQTLFRSRALAWLIRNLDAIPIDNEGIGRSGLQAALAVLAGGGGVVVFAEGTRSSDGTLQPLEPGVSLLIRRARVPVVPAGIVGAFEALPRGRLLPRLSPLWGKATEAALGVSVGEPIPPATLLGRDRDDLLAYVRARVADQIRNASRIRRKSG